MKFLAFILTMLSLGLALHAQEETSEMLLAKAGYNSNDSLLAKAQAVDNAVALIACVACHNSKATYSLITQENEAFKLKYYGVNKAKFVDAKKEFSLDAQDAKKLIAFLDTEISKAKDLSTHKEGAKRGSSFEFSVKNGDSWATAGHYSKGSYVIIKKIATLLKAKNQEEVSSKLKEILSEI